MRRERPEMGFGIGRAVRTGIAAAAWCSALGLAAAAHAQTDDAVTRKAARAFGLAGTWSVDCSKPASRQNPYIMWEVPPAGPVKHRITFDGRWPAPDYVAADGALLEDGHLRLSLLTNGDLVMVITMEKAEGRLHTLKLVDGQGKVRMADGLWVSNGTPTGSSERCKGAGNAVP